MVARERTFYGSRVCAWVFVPTPDSFRALRASYNVLGIRQGSEACFLGFFVSERHGKLSGIMDG